MEVLKYELDEVKDAEAIGVRYAACMVIPMYEDDANWTTAEYEMLVHKCDVIDLLTPLCADPCVIQHVEAIDAMKDFIVSARRNGTHELSCIGEVFGTLQGMPMMAFVEAFCCDV